jgi:hypothetical protein
VFHRLAVGPDNFELDPDVSIRLIAHDPQIEHRLTGEVEGGLQLGGLEDRVLALIGLFGVQLLLIGRLARWLRHSEGSLGA